MKKSIVFYADILGFSDLVMEADKRQEILENIKNSLKSSIRFFEAFNETLKGLPNNLPVRQIQYKLFSDNLYLSINVENEVDFDRSFVLAVVFARSYQESMLHHKYLIRGAISYDEDYNDENIIFSPALIKAYNLESKMAIYPRIIIDLEIIDRLLNKFSLHPVMLTLFNNSIIYDWSFTHFLNPVGLIKDYNPEGEDFDKRKSVDANLRIEMINYLTDKRKLLFNQNKFKEHEKVLWLFELINWLTSLEYSPEQIINKLGFSFIKFNY